VDNKDQGLVDFSLSTGLYGGAVCHSNSCAWRWSIVSHTCRANNTPHTVSITLSYTFQSVRCQVTCSSGTYQATHATIDTSA
jgi:hypothetical protein